MIDTEIRTLLNAPADGVGAPPLAHLEDTLTAGYAHALALEAERWRLERRIAEVAAELDEDSSLRGSELRKLSRSDSSARIVRSISGCVLEARTRCSTLAAIVGEINASPFAAARIPAISCWIDASLRR